MDHREFPRRAPVPAAIADGVPERISAWLVESFIPAWVARTWNPDVPGYAENVTQPSGAVRAAAQRSIMITGRLVYTFSLCHVLGHTGPALAAAEHGLDLLLGPGHLADGGFAHAVWADGAVADPNGDLYDLAFVLLALGGHAAASGRPDLLEIAGAIGERLDRNQTDPVGGYREPNYGHGPRLQYPQMHLFEAFQLLARLAPRRGWERRAEVILDLAERALVLPHGAIDEWYDATWQPVAPGGKAERELGHQFEWAWLLRRHARSTGSARAAALSARVYAYGMAVVQAAGGIGPLPNAIDSMGRPLDAERPIWTLTELLRAAVTLEDEQTARAVLDTLFTRYIDRASGFWINALRPVPGPDDAIVPARMLYHLVPALVAAARAREGAFEIRNPLFDTF